MSLLPRSRTHTFCGTSQSLTNHEDDFYWFDESNDCNFFFEENEIFGRVATEDLLLELSSK